MISALRAGELRCLKYVRRLETPEVSPIMRQHIKPPTVRRCRLTTSADSVSQFGETPYRIPRIGEPYLGLHETGHACRELIGLRHMLSPGGYRGGRVVEFPGGWGSAAAFSKACPVVQHHDVGFGVEATGMAGDRVVEGGMDRRRVVGEKVRAAPSQSRRNFPYARRTGACSSKIADSTTSSTRWNGKRTSR